MDCGAVFEAILLPVPLYGDLRVSLLFKRGRSSHIFSVPEFHGDCVPCGEGLLCWALMALSIGKLTIFQLGDFLALLFYLLLTTLQHFFLFGICPAWLVLRVSFLSDFLPVFSFFNFLSNFLNSVV